MLDDICGWRRKANVGTGCLHNVVPEGKSKFPRYYICLILLFCLLY
jgi:hypothetical protein